MRFNYDPEIQFVYKFKIFISILTVFQKNYWENYNFIHISEAPVAL